MDNFFSCDSVVCGYGKFNLQKISFSIRKGCFAGIIGPNGSGKTTLFKGITGELPIKSGRITIDDSNFLKLKIKDRAKKLAIVNQNIETGDITVEDYVLLGRTPYHSQFQFFDNDKDFLIAEKYMKMTNVLQFRNKFLSELSGGEQQLAAIARALTQEPELLLLDEPTAHLDIAHQINILNLLRRLNREIGITVMLIIHDINLAGEYCEQLIMLKNGSMHSNGTPAEILTLKNIEDVYGAAVVSVTNPISGKPVILPNTL